MRRLGSAKWNFLKAKNTSAEQTSLLNNTTPVFSLSSFETGRHYLQGGGGCFWLLFRERSWLLFWCLKALLQDEWQIDYKLFGIYASINTFGYENEKRGGLGIVDLA